MGAYFDPDIETASRERLREHQYRRLKSVLEVASRRNPFYQQKFQKHGIEIETMKSLDDINKLPFSYKNEFERDHQENPPFGTNLSEPIENFIRYHQTTGTTGSPLKWLETRESWIWRRRVAATALVAAGMQPADISFFAFSFGPHVAFWGLLEGAQEIGSLIIASGGWNTLQRIRCIMENRVTIVLCTPTYALRMAEVAKDHGIDLTRSSVRKLIHAGEPGALVPSFRKRIQEIIGAVPYDYSGLTEVGAYAFQCQHQENATHVHEGEYIIEIIDPETGESLPQGEIGEMVLTNLGRPCSPSVRFRTGDLVRFKKGLCPCGRTFRMLDGGVLGRKDDMILIRGMNVFPSKIGEIVQRHLVIGQEYQIVAYTKDGMGECIVQIEDTQKINIEAARANIEDDLRQSFEIRIDVSVVPRGHIPRFEYKSKRFVDKRKEGWQPCARA